MVSLNTNLSPIMGGWGVRVRVIHFTLRQLLSCRRVWKDLLPDLEIAETYPEGFSTVLKLMSERNNNSARHRVSVFVRLEGILGHKIPLQIWNLFVCFFYF